MAKKELHLFSTPDETQKFAASLAKNAKAGDCFALTGDLGAGKTLFTKAFAKELGIEDQITSPTFTLCEEYDGQIPFYHFDLYRIEDPRELDMLFFEEYWEGTGISVIEWADRARQRIPATAIWINMEYIDDHTRRVEVEYPSD